MDNSEGVLRQALQALSDKLVLLIIESVCGWEEMQSSQCLSDAVRADKSAVGGNTLRFTTFLLLLVALV